MSNRLLAALILWLMVSTSPRPAFAQQSASLSRDELRGAAGDRQNHFGDAPDDAGPLADLDGSLTSASIQTAMQKVADWQLARAEKYFNQQWTFAALYCGLLQASASTSDPKYQDALVAMSEKFKWDVAGSPASANAAAPAAASDTTPPPPDPAAQAPSRRTAPLNANSECLAQTYLDLYFQYKNPWMLAPTRSAFDAVINITQSPPARARARRGPSTRPGDQAADAAQNPHHLIWWWCDALYMGPPAWAKLYQATGDAKYLDYLDHQWWLTSQYLYDPVEHLYYRDNSFIAKHELNGKKVFWSRGEGWVIAGLARVLQSMPGDYPDRPKFISQFTDMAAKIASLQSRDGLWRAGLLDPDAYGLPENSGSAFFTYALAWGINEKILDHDAYEPIVAKAWQGLVSHIHADGRLDCIQQTGASPAHYAPSASYVYGVGAFLLAGREVNKFAITQAMQHRS